MGSVKEDITYVIQTYLQAGVATDQILSLVCKRIEGAKWTEKQIKQASYKAECDLEDMYSRHETCQDKFGCTPMEYIEKAKMQAQRQAIIDVIKEE